MAGVEKTPIEKTLARAEVAGYLAHAVPAQTPEEEAMVEDQERAFEISHFHDELISRVINPEVLKTTINAFRAKLPERTSISFKIHPTNSTHTEIEATVRNEESIVATETTIGLTRIRTTVCYSAAEDRSDSVNWQREPRIWFVPAPKAGSLQTILTGFAALEISRETITAYETAHPIKSSVSAKPSGQ